jgi:hypothetical protein
MRLFSLPANPASKGRTTGLAASSRESLAKTRWRNGGRYVRSLLVATSRLGAAVVNGGCRPRGCGAGLGNARPTPLGTRPRFRLRAADASRSGEYPPDLVVKDAWQGLRYPVNTARGGADVTTTPLLGSGGAGSAARSWGLGNKARAARDPRRDVCPPELLPKRPTGLARPGLLSGALHCYFRAPSRGTAGANACVGLAALGASFS